MVGHHKIWDVVRAAILIRLDGARAEFRRAYQVDLEFLDVERG